MNIFITSGLVILSIASLGLIYDTLYPPQLSFATPPAPHTLSSDQQQGPTRITIPSLAIVQPIVPGIISNNIWSISDNTANHLATSAQPGQGGNIIIYGHDDNDLFGPLKLAKKGQIITLTDHNEKEHRYQIETLATTHPTDVSWIQPTNRELLTVYTCTGFANSRRFIIQAQPLLDPAAAVDLPL